MRGHCWPAVGVSHPAARWHTQATLPATVRQVQFASPSLGVAVRDQACQPGSAPGRCRGSVLISHDGGARWHTVLRSATPVFATMTSAGTVFAAELMAAGSTATSPGADFWTSTDAGATWHQAGQLTAPAPLTASTMMALAASRGQLAWVSLTDPASCAMHGCALAGLYRSKDGGLHWTRASVWPFTGCGLDGLLSATAPDNAIWVASARAGACTPPAGLLADHDLTGWHVLPSPQRLRIAALSAASNAVACVISADDAVATTVDGGLHWATVRPSAGGQSPSAS
jgi:hypothetical protein